MTVKILSSDLIFPKLNKDQAEIRILEVQPGSSGSQIHCKFHVATLDELEQPYETLSYTWGDENEATKVTVWLEKTPVPVARNLFDALQRLRMTHEPRYLWVDALCINQGDDVEKTWQVSMMHRVYSQCHQCAIWLGALGDVDVFHARAAVDTLCWFAGSRGKPDWMDDDSAREYAAKALKILINLPWWSRIWTVQEAILPSSATVYWGPCEISWDLMRRAADSFFDTPSRDIPDEFWDNGGAIDLQSATRGLAFTRKESLFQVLWRWRFRQATDPRDKVYGLVGFRRDTSLPNVRTCDYTIDVRTLYQRVTADLIHRGLYGVGEGLKVEDDRILCLHGLQIDRISVVEDRSKETCVEDYGSAGSMFLAGGGRWGKVITEFQEKCPGQLPDNWMSAFLGLITGKLALFITESGRFGLGPRNIQPGQEVWVIGGCRFPVVLNRRAGGFKDEGFTFAGECFVYGVMRGEAVEGRSDEQREIKLY
ncbi:uncharacterized protein NECHADRAFT_80908 [Fusarium vanettenii 77-13-4]|uniref:Heterokaryon incompatibility domain-containing protein n=1 Tax=Fusarium vanettenii (strain ATCC MYA-4622 / CBS 123669 / FGSC 9596 / NRRL 45880 / 77-13-4) TaxID=660122 RepID=C7YT07_FUSV7|nr:uncharacterized protein NECHADRAFT_80908 [Fusarium vanettenii 77-13-4]EEU45330.1 hypothetical protein NECHADRAFT_80908 [Fusarium vanettenii 77-13-4]